MARIVTNESLIAKLDAAIGKYVRQAERNATAAERNGKRNESQANRI